MDFRDQENFDKKWINEYDFFKENVNKLNDEDKLFIDEVREKIYKSVYSITHNAELSAYISDDFDLITKAICLNEKDRWLIKYYIKNI